MLEDLLAQALALGFGGRGYTKIVVAALIENRESVIYDRVPEDQHTGGADLLEADAKWLLSFIRKVALDDRYRFGNMIGQGLRGTTVEAAINHIITSLPQDIGDIADVFESARRGESEALLSQISASQGSDDRPSIGDVVAFRSMVGELSDKVAVILTDHVMKGMPRKAYLRHINCLIVLDEAVLMHAAGRHTAATRKIAIEYALMRILGKIETLAHVGLDEIEQIFRQTGRVSRLYNPLSDALDNVQKYASRLIMDPDGVDDAILSGRPAFGSPENLRRAALQSRKFRDRERS